MCRLRNESAAVQQHTIASAHLHVRLEVQPVDHAATLAARITALTALVTALATFGEARQALAASDAPWKLDFGPIAAALLSARRLGGDIQTTVQGSTEVHLPSFGAIDLYNFGPVTLKALLLREAEHWILGRHVERNEVLQDLGAPPFLAPIRALLRNSDKPDWGKAEKGMLRALVADALPSQARLHARGKATTAACRACGAAVGDAWHRWFCPGTEAFRRSYNHDGFTPRPPPPTATGRIFGTRALIVDPTPWLPRPQAAWREIWLKVDDIGLRLEVVN